MKIIENEMGGIGICVHMNGWGINIVETYPDTPGPVAISFLPMSTMKMPGLISDLLVRTFVKVSERHGKQDMLFAFVEDHEIFDKCQEMLKNLGDCKTWLDAFAEEVKAKKAQ